MIRLSLNIIIYSLLVIVEFGCGKRCNEPDHNFKISDSFYPEKDSIKVGDTLYFECIIPKMEKDTITGMIINFSNLANLGDNLIISDISKFKTGRDAADSFSFFNVFGNIYTDEHVGHQLNFSETDSDFRARIGIIALKAGLYVFTLPDAPGIYRKGHLKCGIGNFQILNSNIDKHLYLFTNMWGDIISNYDSLHSYCIKVN